MNFNFLSHGLVLHRKQQPAKAEDAGTSGGGGPKTGDINLSNILKLIPGDVVAIYLAGKGAPIDPIGNVAWPVLLFWLCLIACFGLRCFLTRQASGSVNWMFAIVTTIAFFVWAHAVNEDAGPVIATFKGSGAGIVAMLLGLFAPVVVPAKPEP
jgi:hypothetical protein